MFGAKKKLDSFIARPPITVEATNKIVGQNGSDVWVTFIIKLKSEVGLEDVWIWAGVECWAELIDQYHLRTDQHCVIGARMMGEALMMMMTPLSLCCVDLRVDNFNCKSCLSKSALLRANKIACSGWLNGSRMNSPNEHVGTDGGHLRDSGLTVEVQDEWIAMMRWQEPAIVSPKSG